MRTPRRENCRFFATPAQAEAAAFRPCLKCRPEIAPGLSQMDSSRTLADTAARCIEQAVQKGQPPHVAALARRLGVTDRHLRRIFMAAHGVAPLDYITTQRLLLAKQLLTDTSQPVTGIALASGFASLRRFNAAFVERYRFNPTQLRRSGADAGNAQALRLAYRPPYDVSTLLAFLARRALRGVEEVQGLTLRRTLAWPKRAEYPGHQTSPQADGHLNGWLACRFEPDRHEVHVQTSESLNPVLGAVLQAVRQALDLDADPALIDPVLARLPVPLQPGTRLPGAMDGFEGAVRVILGQQITVKAATTLAQRLVARFGEPLATPFAALTHVFPRAAALAAADPAALSELGIVRQRVQALQALAAAVAGGRLALHRGAPLQITLDALRALPGVGEWTAQVIAMRVLAWPDAWPRRRHRPGARAADRVARFGAVARAQRRDTRCPGRTLAAVACYAVMRLWHHLENPS